VSDRPRALHTAKARPEDHRIRLGIIGCSRALELPAEFRNYRNPALGTTLSQAARNENSRLPKVREPDAMPLDDYDVEPKGSSGNIPANTLRRESNTRASPGTSTLGGRR
jgi:hypothetical protein